MSGAPESFLSFCCVAILPLLVMNSAEFSVEGLKLLPGMIWRRLAWRFPASRVDLIYINIILYYINIILYYIYYIILYILYYIVLYCIILYCIILYYIILYDIILYYNIIYYNIIYYYNIILQYNIRIPYHNIYIYILGIYIYIFAISYHSSSISLESSPLKMPRGAATSSCACTSHVLGDTDPEILKKVGFAALVFVNLSQASFHRTWPVNDEPWIWTHWTSYDFPFHIWLELANSQRLLYGERHFFQ